MPHIDTATSEELWKSDINGTFPILLEIYNPDISWTDEAKQVYQQEDSYLRIIADESKVVYKGKTYLPCSFDYTEPEKDGAKIGSAQLSITALDYKVRQVIRQIRKKSSARVIAMFAKTEKNESTGKFIYKFIEISSIKFCLRVANMNKSVATFNLEFNTSSNQNIPFDIATEDRVPSTKG